MKVGVWISFRINKKEGGGNTYTEELIRLIDEYEFSNSFEVVFLTENEVDESIFKKKIIKITPPNQAKTRENFINKLLRKFNMFEASPIKEESVEHQLKNKEVDIIYFLEQHPKKIFNYPFIATNWDIGHLTMEAFPEVTHFNKYENRNSWYQFGLKKALKIIAESDCGKTELIEYCNINPSRIEIMPMFSRNFENISKRKENSSEILELYGLEKYNYFFYPAQFWPHKNHKHLLDAFSCFIQKKATFKLVLSGGDKGNLNYIKNYVDHLNLSQHVIFPGFVDDLTIKTFYRYSSALVMPTFLGPTNLPLLEARELGCPIICTNLSGHKEQLADGAIYINPLEPSSILDAMFYVIDEANRSILLNKSLMNKQHSKFNSSFAMKELNRILLDSVRIVSCWKSGKTHFL